MEDEFHVGSETLFPQGNSWIVPRHSPLRQGDFLHGLRRLIDSGILQRAYFAAGRRPPRRPQPKVRVDSPLTLMQLQSAGFILALGLTIALLLFFGERAARPKRLLNLNFRQH